MLAAHTTEFDEPAEPHAAGHDAHGGHEDHNPLSPDHLFGHVRDSMYFELPKVLGGKVELPQWFLRDQPIVAVRTGSALIDDNVAPLQLKFTKFMALELVAAVIMVLLFTRLAARLKNSTTPKGPVTNALEAVVQFIRDDIARPAIGHHDADRFMPFLLTAFFFVVTCNLLGLVPWAGSATGALSTTIALALMTFFTVLATGMAKLGPMGYWTAQIPHIDVQPKLLAYVLQGGIFLIEMFGLLVKHFVLAIRLFANMMAGHLVLAVVMAFIGVTAGTFAFWGVMPASVFGAVALSLLELMVAFIQAYVFTFLSALFIGMAVHPH